VLALITPTTDYAHVKGADLVIEAVFETREIKADVTKKAEAELAPDAVFGSNTSTLPITGLAEASARPENFIGVHFFSPVDKMMLVEIIMGEKTSQEALAKAIDYVLKIKKTPIVVNDSRGFYTSRCFSTYLTEGMEMLSEGISPVIIDNVGPDDGMPRGPLEMHDDVALDLSHKIAQQTKKDLGDAWKPSATSRSSRRWWSSSAATGEEPEGLLRLPGGRRAEAAVVRAGGAGASDGERGRPGRGRGAEDAAAVPAGGGSGALLRRGRGHRSARRRRGRHPGLGLRALVRRPAVADRRGGRGRLRAHLRPAGGGVRTPVQGAGPAAPDGRRGRSYYGQARENPPPQPDRESALTLQLHRALAGRA
jgi:hypothetical protein